MECAADRPDDLISPRRKTPTSWRACMEALIDAEAHASEHTDSIESLAVAALALVPDDDVIRELPAPMRERLHACRGILQVIHRQAGALRGAVEDCAEHAGAYTAQEQRLSPRRDGIAP